MTGPDREDPIGRGMSSEVYPHGPGEVLKLFRETANPAAIANEFRATALARTLGLPVPEPVSIARRGERTGIVFEHLEGRTMLRTYAGNPPGLLMALARLARLHRRIHRHAAPGLPAQHATLRTQVGWARVSDHAKRVTLSILDGLPEGSRLCHGDFHPGNVICTPAGWRVIDWQKAVAGNPAADVARTAVLIRHGRLGTGWIGRALAATASRELAAAWYVACYAAASGVASSEIRAWRLPMTVSRLIGRPAPNEEAVRDAVERLARSARP